MDSKLKEILIKKVLENIPDKVKPVTHLTGILDIGRESAYRRLNGQIDFSLAEIVKLSSRLNFSLNEIHNEYDDNLAAFEFYKNRLNQPEESFKSMLQALYNRMATVYEAKEKHTDIAVNRLIGTLALAHNHLYKFIYYKWKHQFDNVPLNYYYRELVLSSDISNLIQKASYYQQRLSKTIILDEDILYNTIQEIKYYQDRQLISNDEVALIKGDLIDLLENFEQILNTGENQIGIKWDIYLSSINVCSNTSCLNYDDQVSTSFWIHSDAAFTTSDSQIYLLQKEWIDSLKKHSTLITKSNQKMQADFLNQQYKYLEEI
ncbi:hypothetical protein [uncultured Dysgonomonas sp.]|uniref:Transcription regulator BetR N-terminal domain-containing protein n=1 Tax=uncultured Dysgonomonas sp. TaxID=206096 RepID=A0A212JTP9_9BACT|nr:hypothetical protein [uncultured Dysgonomonas sp.]SBW02816.1 conserved hypothetical protein [uncultured Dysgonomonas sp.]